MQNSIGVNLRVTGYSNQGGRKYMEDAFSVAYQSSDDEKNLEYAFFGVFDGHGGSEASNFAREHLMDSIVEQKLFWSDDDDDVLRAIREGYIATHYAMWREQDKWPKTATGLPSTAGTTASIAFIRHGKLYIGHVGDSGIVLGYQEEGENFWRAQPLTQDHKPECNIELARIISSGGKVMIKSGVHRVVWNRPRLGHKGPVRRSTPIDEIPFLAVARSLGDLWSYNSTLNEFVVSPDPDVQVIKIDIKKFRCLVFGTDGLWNVASSREAVEHVRVSQEENDGSIEWKNASKCLVDHALKQWNSTRTRADNISVITIMLYPPGPPPKYALNNSDLFCEDSLDYAFDCDYLHERDVVTMYNHNADEERYYPSSTSHPTSSNSIAMMTRYDKSDDLCYMNSFAEFYENSLYNNPHESVLKHNQSINQFYSHPTENNFNSETYSLTKLQTRTEQMNSMNNYVEYENIKETDYHHHPHQPIHYPSPLEFHDYQRPNYPIEENNEQTYNNSNISNSYSCENNISDLPICDSSQELSNLDESIQINEVSSSVGTNYIQNPNINQTTDVIMEENISSKYENNTTTICIDTTNDVESSTDLSKTIEKKSKDVRSNKSDRIKKNLDNTSLINHFEPPVTRSKDLLLNNNNNNCNKINSTNRLRSRDALLKKVTKVQMKSPQSTTTLCNSYKNITKTLNTTTKKYNKSITKSKLSSKPLLRSSNRHKLCSSSNIVTSSNISKRISLTSSNWHPRKLLTQSKIKTH